MDQRKSQSIMASIADMGIPGPVFPKEHGAWAVLFVPLITGAAIAGGLNTNVILLAISVLGVFLCTVPVQILLKHIASGSRQEKTLRNAYFWGIIYLGLGMGFLIPLLRQGYWMLAPIGVAATVSLIGSFFDQRRLPRTMFADLIAIGGLTLSGLAAYYVISGIIDSQALVVWLLNVLFFSSSVFYVHLKIGSVSSRTREESLERLQRLNILYHIGVLTTILALTMLGVTPWMTVLAFVPIAVHTLYGTLHPLKVVAFKKLGLLLLGQSILFGFLLWISFR